MRWRSASATASRPTVPRQREARLRLTASVGVATLPDVAPRPRNWSRGRRRDVQGEGPGQERDRDGRRVERPAERLTASTSSRYRTARAPASARDLRGCGPGRESFPAASRPGSGCSFRAPARLPTASSTRSISLSLRSIFSLFSSDLAIDLGTANTCVYARGQGHRGQRALDRRHQQDHRPGRGGRQGSQGHARPHARATSSPSSR